MKKIKSEVEFDESDGFLGFQSQSAESSNVGNTLGCFCCNFETNNIDELDEHIVCNHGDQETNKTHDPDKKFQIVADPEPVQVPSYKKRQLESAVVKALAKKIPRGKIIVRPHETKFQICNDPKFSITKEKKGTDSPRKRARRTPGDEITCHLCPFVTRKKSVLATHMLNHSDLIPPVYYKCSQCPYQTKRKNDMPKHMLGHCSNAVMHKCPICPYQTKRKNDLPKHVLCHKPTDSVPLYKCQYCPYVTKRKGDLPKHEMNHAERDKIFSWNCTECEYSSKRKNDLHKHMLVHSDRQLAGVFKCLKCVYATDKVVKFSRHVLSKCQIWDEPINLEHMMLEDILASVDKDGMHVMIDGDSDGEVHVQEESVHYIEGEGVEYIEYVEEGETVMVEEVVEHYVESGVEDTERTDEQETQIQFSNEKIKI